MKRIIASTCRRIIAKLNENERFRRFYFESQSPGSLLLTSTPHGHFLVNTSDQTIGRTCYVKRQPYDYDRFLLALQLLPTRQQIHTLVDIGANIGTISIAALNDHKIRRVIAVEPEPRNFALLQANIRINKQDDHFTLFNLAATGPNEHNLIFELSEKDYGDHRVRHKTSDGLFSESTRECIEVGSIQIDNLLQNFDPTTCFIWIDTQGYEGNVLSGSREQISRRVPICFEFWPYGLKRTGGFPLLKEALNNGTYNFLVDLNEPDKRLEFSIAELDKIFETIGTEGAYTDILIY